MNVILNCEIGNLCNKNESTVSTNDKTINDKTINDKTINDTTINDKTVSTNRKTNYVLNKINDHFQIPIHYNNSKVEINPNIITDLELLETIDSSNTNIYSFLLNPSNDVSRTLTKQIAKYYTTDILFLKESQHILSNYKVPFNNSDSKEPIKSKDYTNIIKIWNELKDDIDFKDKYYYVDWKMLEFLNKSTLFLQFSSLYNILSPVFSILCPLILLIIPFFIIKLKGLEINFNEYFDILFVLAKTNAIGKLFTTNYNEIGGQELVYLFISAGFYLFSIYQNIMICIKFNNNMKKIHEHFNDICEYLETTIENMEHYLEFTKDLQTYKEFNDNAKQKIQPLKEMYNKLSVISEYSLTNYKKINEIGLIMLYFYELHTDPFYEDAILYSIGFNGHLDCMRGLQDNIQTQRIQCAEFITDEQVKMDKELNKKNKKQIKKDKKNKKENKKNKKDLNNETNEDLNEDLNEDSNKPQVCENDESVSLSSNYNIFVNNYYASLAKTETNDVEPIKNTVQFDKNIILTGPNASGKTTILKSTLINIIFTQQFGCGFYESAKLNPYKHIHCYLNIPDTSGRDSLFQAEARRCKEILDSIHENKDDTHFCVFDELYSGTNPDEAEQSAASFMLYLQKYNKVHSILTTHFFKVCEKLDKEPTIENYRMKAEKNDNKIKYFYEIEKGISQVKGGINILTDMNYPEEIINNTKCM
jgi:hypothetical protein